VAAFWAERDLPWGVRGPVEGPVESWALLRLAWRFWSKVVSGPLSVVRCCPLAAGAGRVAVVWSIVSVVDRVGGGHDVPSFVGGTGWLRSVTCPPGAATIARARALGRAPVLVIRMRRVGGSGNSSRSFYQGSFVVFVRVVSAAAGVGTGIGRGVVLAASEPPAGLRTGPLLSGVWEAPCSSTAARPAAARGLRLGPAAFPPRFHTA
jgi:hypothetical protein